MNRIISTFNEKQVWYNNPKDWHYFTDWMDEIGCLNAGILTLLVIPILAILGIIYGIYRLVCFIARKKARIIVASILLVCGLTVLSFWHYNDVQKENLCWETAQNEHNYNSYLSEYPNGNHSLEAKKLVLEEEKRKEEELWNTDSKAWNEATSRNISTSYKKYLELYPYGANAQNAQKMVIDKEVDEIFGSNHGTLPSMDKTSYASGTHSTISVYNNTSYTLTLRYSGNDSKIINISSHSRQSITLPNGNYRIAASVSAASVRNFAGQENLTGGSYDVTYYISTSRY
jgi:hypothetical protein